VTIVRRVIYSVAASLDGYIAGPGGEYDWIPDEQTIDWKAFMARFDTILVGRLTWEVVARDEGGVTMPAYVFSRTLEKIDHPRATLVSGDPRPVVDRLRAEPGRDLWLMGGGVLFREFLERDLVDVVEVAVVPILLGHGIPTLPHMPRSTGLTVTNTTTYPSGIILLTYDVVRDG
jgi:dihydrofolate reductase